MNQELLKSKKMSRRITISGAVIASYILVMFLAQGVAFGAYQIRIATSIYALGALEPFLILPLGAANMLSNILLGSLGPLDMIGGFVVGVLTAGSCYLLGKKYTSLVAIPIMVIPTLLVPLWLSYLLQIPYIALVISVGIGQILPGLFGILLVKYLAKPLGGNSYE